MSTQSQDRDELVARVREQAWIDDPTTGFVDAAEFAERSLIWPDDRWTSVVPAHRFSSEKRDVWEYLYTRETGEPLEVPVAIVWDKTNEDLRARVYYNKAHFGLTDPRRPLVAPEDEPLPEDLAAYRDVIRGGDPESLAKILHPDAAIMSPFGPLSTKQVIDSFSNHEAGVAGVPLQICTFVQDGPAHAVEFISWRRPPHGGLCVYTFEDGRVIAIRAYEGPVRR